MAEAVEEEGEGEGEADEEAESERAEVAEAVDAAEGVGGASLGRNASTSSLGFASPNMDDLAVAAAEAGGAVTVRG